MKYLFDSKGNHIANIVNDQLHAPTGENIGHYLKDYGIFIDMEGQYLGEIIYSIRLVYNTSSPYCNTNFCIYGDHGNVGNYGNAGNCGVISLPTNHKDIEVN